MTIFEVLGGLSCVASAIGVSMLGLTIIDRPRVSWHSRRKSAEIPRFVGNSGPAFQPVDLGPVPLKWPSEQVWPPSRLPTLPWPSETWTDDFFKGRQGAHKAAAPEPKAVTAPEPPAQESAPKKKREEQKKKKPAPPTPPTPAIAPPAARGGVEDDLLLAWADEKGLASAVEMLRDRNGWEFQQAAQHLARLMRARREGGR